MLPAYGGQVTLLLTVDREQSIDCCSHRPLEATADAMLVLAAVDARVLSQGLNF